MTEMIEESPQQSPRDRQDGSPRWMWLIGGAVLIVGLLALLFGLDILSSGPRAGSIQTSAADDMEQVYIPEGQFRMGSASEGALPDVKPQHAVYLNAYWMDRTEVTNQQFMAFVEATGYRTTAEEIGQSWVFELGSWREVEGVNWRHPRGQNTDLEGRGDHPVVHVSWQDARTYCEWAGRRLPTEAEWEKAGRGTKDIRYPWGNQPADGTRANFADRSLSARWSNMDVDDGYARTAPAASFEEGASPYGLQDMAGNVYEWVRDWYQWDYYYRSPYTNPTGPDSGNTAPFGAPPGSVKPVIIIFIHGSACPRSIPSRTLDFAVPGRSSPTPLQGGMIRLFHAVQPSCIPCQKSGRWEEKEIPFIIDDHEPTRTDGKDAPICSRAGMV